MWGAGVLNGLAVTFKNFLDTYTKKDGIYTVQYPEERLPQKERFRNFPILVFDETPENLRCVACDICAKECPPACITIVKEKDAAGKPMKAAAVFDIDFSICMNCGICEEVCPFDAIYMDHEFELASYDRMNDLIYRKDRLSKTWSYFEKIRPTDAAPINAKRAKVAAAAKAKAAQAAKPPTKPPTDPPANPSTQPKT